MALYMNKRSPYVVFYDIDGVLTSNRIQLARHTGNTNEIWNVFDKNAIDVFNNIYIRANCQVEFTCISTWRNTFKSSDTNTSHVFISMLRNAGLIGKIDFKDWTVNPEADPNLVYDKLGRAEEIRLFLESRPWIKDFIIFDDSDFGFDEILGKKRFVKTNSNEGMLFKNILDAYSIVGNWK